MSLFQNYKRLRVIVAERRIPADLYALHERRADSPMTYEEYRKKSYFPQLDGIRALSIGMVISYHLQDKSFNGFAGFLGVTLFFILSGFLITTLALREEEKAGKLKVKAFYVRRLYRILPLYIVALVLNIGFYGFWGKPEPRAAFLESLPAYFLYYQEVNHAEKMVSGEPEAPFGHSWSLGIEEKFYLVWPFLIFVLLFRYRRLRLPAAFTLCFLFGLMPLLKDWGLPVLAFCLHPYHHILFGCCLALLLHDRANYERLHFLRMRYFGLFAALALTVVQLLMPFCSEAGYGSGWQSLYCLLGTLLIGAVCTRTGGVATALSLQPVVWIGTLSYGMYLFHFIAIGISKKLLEGNVLNGLLPYGLLIFSVLVSIMIASALSVLIERPMIRLGQKRAAEIG